MDASTNVVFLVIGPESSGTRIFTELLSNHPDIAGTRQAKGHADLLDGVWARLAGGNLAEARRELASFAGKRVLLTRRSLPHGAAPGVAAEFMKFSDLAAFHSTCTEVDRRLSVLITSRSPAANIASWAAERASVNGSAERAAQQYLAAYRHLFRFLAEREVAFLLLSLEALALEGGAYLDSLFRLMGLADCTIACDRRADVNTRRYADLAGRPEPCTIL